MESSNLKVVDDDKQTKKAIPDLSLESQLLYKRLKELKINDFVSYQELSDIAGRDVQGRGRGNLHTAMRLCLRQDSIVLKAVIKEGVKRIDDVSNIKGGNSLNRIKRIARRRRAELHCVDYKSLNRELQAQHNIELSQLGAAEYFSGKSAGVKLIGACERSALPVGKTIEFFRAK